MKWASQAFDPSLPYATVRSRIPIRLFYPITDTEDHGIQSAPGRSRTISIDGITLHLAQPMTMAQEWIGNRKFWKQLLACWLVIDERDLPLTSHHRATRHRQNHVGHGGRPRA